jgi:hypothetical protein
MHGNVMQHNEMKNLELHEVYIFIKTSNAFMYFSLVFCTTIRNKELFNSCHFIFITGCADATSVTPPPPELVALPPDIADGDSSSSEDRPIISRREPVGTKRKAEVLSKESGKIGVTITTSSSSSSSSGAGSPPPSKLPRLLPVKSLTAPTSPSYNVSDCEICPLLSQVHGIMISLTE